MDVVIHASGDVTERLKLLNGTQSVTIEGASDDGAWTLTGVVAWNIGLREFAGEGDLTLARDDGAEIFATLTRADVHEGGDDGASDYTLRLAYDIDGGTGVYAGIAGSADGSGALSGEAFRLDVAVRIVPQAGA